MVGVPQLRGHEELLPRHFLPGADRCAKGLTDFRFVPVDVRAVDVSLVSKAKYPKWNKGTTLVVGELYAKAGNL